MTKVWATYNTRIAEGLEKSLKSLGVDYVDLYLIVSFPSSSPFFYGSPLSLYVKDGQFAMLTRD